MTFFKPIPDETSASGHAEFTLRKIRKAGEQNVLAATERLLAKFVDDGDEMLVSEMSDLIEVLHRAASLVQKTKHAVMLKKLKKVRK